jgi:hypothetical protein
MGSDWVLFIPFYYIKICKNWEKVIPAIHEHKRLSDPEK